MGQHQGLMLAIFITSLAILIYQVQSFGVPRNWNYKAPPVTTNKTKPDPWSLTTAAAAYRQYETVANTETSRMQTSFGKLTSEQQGIATSVKYGNKLDRLDEATRINAGVTGGIADLAVRELGSNASELETREGGSLFRTRETLLHFVRDWSEEGADERNVIFEPILRVLNEVNEGTRGNMKVLVPGSGLARLAWEISQLGEPLQYAAWLMGRISSYSKRAFMVYESRSSVPHSPFSNEYKAPTYNSAVFSSILKSTLK